MGDLGLSLRVGLEWVLWMDWSLEIGVGVTRSRNTSELHSVYFKPSEPPSVQIEDKGMSGGKASKLKPCPRQTLPSAIIVGSSGKPQVTL